MRNNTSISAQFSYKNKVMLILWSVCFFMLLGCGTDPSEGPGLYYNGNNPMELTLGDTSSVLKFTKVNVTSANGKSETIHDYLKVSLISSDTSLVKALGLKLIGVKKAAEVLITAYSTTDDKSTSFKVNVVE